MKSTTGKCFLDTNIFVYLFTHTDTEKRSKSQAILKELDGKVRFVISTQVIKEFVSVMLNKFQMEPLVVKGIINDMCNFEVVNVNINTINNAIDIKILNQLSFWDSLIISAAKSANCTIMLTEDMSDGQIIDGIKIQNPFVSEN